MHTTLSGDDDEYSDDINNNRKMKVGTWKKIEVE